jgi:DNA-binding NarL/FixJ family response regulator
MSDAVRILLVEDDPGLAREIVRGLERDGWAVDHVACLADAFEAVVLKAFRVILLDRRLPDGDGIAIIGQVAAAAPGARVLVLTGEATASVAARVAEAGGAGLVLKSARLQELAAAVRRVAAGEVVFAPGLLAGVLDRLTGRVRITGAVLTPRERETLVLLAEGVSTTEIGQRLGVARNTARNHVQRVLEKLGARSKLEAVAIARRDGLLD